MVAAVKQNYPQREIADASYELQGEINNGRRFVVGVNSFTEGDEDQTPLRTSIPRSSAGRLTASRQSGPDAAPRPSRSRSPTSAPPPVPSAISCRSLSMRLGRRRRRAKSSKRSRTSGAPTPRRRSSDDDHSSSLPEHCGGWDDPARHVAPTGPAEYAAERSIRALHPVHCPSSMRTAFPPPTSSAAAACLHVIAPESLRGSTMAPSNCRSAKVEERRLDRAAPSEWRSPRQGPSPRRWTPPAARDGTGGRRHHHEP